MFALIPSGVEPHHECGPEDPVTLENHISKELKKDVPVGLLSSSLCRPFLSYHLIPLELRLIFSYFSCSEPSLQDFTGATSIESLPQLRLTVLFVICASTL